MLILSNNYATRSIPAATVGSASGGPITMVVTFETGATIPDGGIFNIGAGAQNQYTGFRISAGYIQGGMRTVAATPVNIAALSPNTLYTAVLTRDNAGNSSITLNGGAPVTQSVSPGAITYTYYGVGTYWNGSYISTSQLKIAHVALYRRALTSDEIAAYHAKNLDAIATTNRFDYHSLVSDLDSDAGGTALTFVDAESDPASFDAYDPFAPLYSVTNINGGNPATYGQAVTWTAAGFSPNAATVDGVSATAVSASGMTLPALVDGQAAPRPGSRAVVASEGGNSANATIPVSAPAGYQYIQLTAQTSDPAKATPPEAAPGDHWMVETKNNTVAYDNGLVETDHVGTVIAWLIKDDTKIAGQYAIIFGEVGEYIETRKISARKIYAEKIKAVKITASRI